MNREDIIRLAREVGDVETDSRNRETFNFDCYGLEHFANLVIDAELRKLESLCDAYLAEAKSKKEGEA